MKTENPPSIPQPQNESLICSVSKDLCEHSVLEQLSSARLPSSPPAWVFMSEHSAVELNPTEAGLSSASWSKAPVKETLLVPPQRAHKGQESQDWCQNACLQYEDQHQPGLLPESKLKPSILSNLALLSAAPAAETSAMCFALPVPASPSWSYGSTSSVSS